MGTREERRARLRAARLYLVTDERLEHAELLRRLRQSLEAGARVVQFRAPSLKRRDFLDRAAEVQALCREHGALFIVNDAADVAAALHADGLHLGQDDLPVEIARPLVGPDMLIGLSVSALAEAQRAAGDAAIDYLGVGSIYPTETKLDAEYGGLSLLQQVRAAVDLPLVAIGGITVERAGQVWPAGADLIAVVSAVFSAPDSGQATRALSASAPPAAERI
jgi:thiamine-phosphate diphosphorylase